MHGVNSVKRVIEACIFLLYRSKSKYKTVMCKIPPQSKLFKYEIYFNILIATLVLEL
jgi:hypothetical protein